VKLDGLQLRSLARTRATASVAGIVSASPARIS
jgi:hypothetical protein